MTVKEKIWDRGKKKKQGKCWDNEDIIEKLLQYRLIKSNQTKKLHKKLETLTIHLEVVSQIETLTLPLLKHSLSQKSFTFPLIKTLSIETNCFSSDITWAKLFI